MSSIPREDAPGKVCRVCGLWKPLDSFKKSWFGHEHKCMDCRAPDRRRANKRSVRNGVAGQECGKCGEWKPLNEYPENGKSKNGAHYYCHKCMADKSRQGYESDPQAWNERSRADYHRNRDSRLETVHQYRQENLEEIREYDRKRNKERYQADPGARAVYSHARRARERNAEGSYTADEWRKLCKKYRHTCLRCGRVEPDIQLTPDHVVPLSKGGSNDIGNIQPLCLQCNLIKATKATDYR